MIDLKKYKSLDTVDRYYNPAHVDLFDYLEYERNMFEPGGVYIKFTYSLN